MRTEPGVGVQEREVTVFAVQKHPGGRKVKTLWAVACPVIVVAGAFVLGGGCASTKSQVKEFGRLDVGEGPGATLTRLVELQKQTNPTNTIPAVSPQGSTIKEEKIPTQPAPDSQKPNSAAAAQPQDAPKANNPPVKRNSPPPENPSAALSTLPPVASLAEAKRESLRAVPMDTPSQPPHIKVPSGSPLSATDQNYRLGPEDVIYISVWGNTELTMEVIVRPDGKVSIPLLQDVQAEGLTAGELADVIQLRLRAYINEPSVSVIVKQVNASKFYIVGYVNKPGTYALRGDVTILQAISLAGGFTQFASPRKIRLVRIKGSNQEVRVLNYYRMIDTSGEGNYLLKPGDTIVVP
jgi:polysaccharide export outer membrane protein